MKLVKRWYLGGVQHCVGDTVGAYSILKYTWTTVMATVCVQIKAGTIKLSPCCFSLLLLFSVHCSIVHWLFFFSPGIIYSCFVLLMLLSVSVESQHYSFPWLLFILVVQHTNLERFFVCICVFWCFLIPLFYGWFLLWSSLWRSAPEVCWGAI